MMRDGRSGFGLVFDVEAGIDLETLTPVSAGASAIVVQRGEVPRDAGERLAADSHEGRSVQWVDRLQDGAVRYSSVDYGSFLIGADGTSLICEPRAGREGWESILISQVLPLVATVRGLEPLHASGVIVDGAAALFVARSGGGKTTLAAHLVARGADLLADDAAALALDPDGALIAHAAGDRLHLSLDDAHEVTSTGGSHLRIAGRRHDKAVVVAPRPAQLSAHVSAVCLLDRVAGRTELEPLIVQERAPSAVDLIGASFNLTIRTPQRLLRQLDVCTRIVRDVPVYRVAIGPSDGPAFAAEEMLRVLRSA